MSEVLGCLVLYLLEATTENQQKCEGKAKPNEFGFRDIACASNRFRSPARCVHKGSSIWKYTHTVLSSHSLAPSPWLLNESLPSINTDVIEIASSN